MCYKLKCRDLNKRVADFNQLIITEVQFLISKYCTYARPQYEVELMGRLNRYNSQFDPIALLSSFRISKISW